MRQLLLLLAGVAFAHAAVVPTQEGYFAAGREYLYRYDGQVLSGIPGVSKEVAGIKIVADTRIQMKENNKCLLRMEEVQLSKLQTETENPAKQQSEDKLQRLQPEIERPILDQLVRPIEFRYVDGKVSNIVTSQDEPVWASNVKKAVLELMLVNIRGTDDLNEPDSQSTQPSNIIHQKEHYRVMERGIAGNCESVYNVKVSKPVSNIIDKHVQPQRFVLNITKTRDLLECQQRTQRSKLSILSGKKCEKCQRQEQEEEETQQPDEPIPEPFNQPKKSTEKKEDLLKCLSQVRYSISLKDHTKFVIDAVVAEGKHIFQPFGRRGGQAITFVNQTFMLKNNRETPQDNLIPDVTNPKPEAEDLSFIFQDWTKHEHDAEEDRELTAEDGPHMSQIRTKVKLFLQKIFDSIHDDRITEEAPKNFILLVKTLKKFSPLELNNIFDRLGKKFASDTEEVKEKKQFLLDAMIQVENDKSVEILIDQIGKRNLIKEEASQILSTIALINEPTEEMLDGILALCKGAVLNGLNADKQVRKTCWLSFGSLVHKACKINKVCSEDKKQEYSLNLLAGIDPSRSDEDKRMCLKAIGNAGLVLKKTTNAETDSIDRIAEIITSTITDVDLRVQGIYSLRRLAKTEPQRVVPLLMPIVKNVEEDHQVRVAAYVIIMDAEPKVDVVQSIVNELKRDKSKQVASFIYTHLKGLVSNYQYCNKNLTKVARKALMTLKPIVEGAQYSKRFMWSPIFWEQKISLSTEASLIGTPASPFPVSGSVKLGANILNHQLNVVEAGFHAKNLRDIAEKILGIARPVRKTQEMRKKLNGRLPESQEKSPAQRDLDALDEQLPTTVIDSDTNALKASGYLKFFGNELRTFTLDKPTIWSYLEGTSEKMADIENKMRSGENPYSYRKIFSLGRGVHEIPTEIGLPLQLWIDSAAMVALDVEGKAVLTPRLTDILSDKATKLETVDVTGTVKPRAAVSILGKMKVSLDNVMSGLYLSGNMNTSAILNGKLNVDVAKKLYETRFDTPSTEHQAVSLRSRPYTFTYIERPEQERFETPEVVRDSQENSPYTFHKRPIKGKLMSPRPVTSTWNIGKESLGVEMELKTRRVPRSCSFTYSPTHLIFNGPIDVNMTVRPGQNAPRNIVAYMKLENEFKTQQQYQEFKEKFLLKQHFSTESSSEESEEHDHIDREDVPIPMYQRPGTSFRTMGTEFLKRFEDWKYDSAKWPFTREEVMDRTHDHTEEVIPDNSKSVELYHIYFNVSTNGTQPIRELVSRISLDQEDEFYKAVRIDVMTANKRFRPDPVHQNELREETEDIQTLCIQGELEHPAYAATLPESQKLESIQSLPDAPLDPKVLLKFNSQWGKSCLSDQKMQIKARVQRSEKQQRDLSEETPDKIECLKNIQENNKYTEACRSLRREREELRAVHAEMTINELVKKQYKVYFYQGLDMVKNLIKGKVSTEQAEVHNPDKTALLTGELDESNRKMNISIKHVRGNVKFEHVWIPSILQDLKVLQPYKLQQHMVMSYSEDPLSGRNINKCKSLRNDSVITFDKLMVNYEQSMCDHILAKDCSSKERFVILSRKLTQTGTKKIITVYIDNTKIQFVPNLLDEDITTLVNESNVNLEVLKKLIVEDGVIKKVPIDLPTVHIMDLEKPEEMSVFADPFMSSSRERRQQAWDMPESASSEEVQMGSEELQHWEDFKDHVKQDIAMAPQQLAPKPKTIAKIIRTKLGDSIMLFAPEQELKVFFDGHNVKVELPLKYKGLHCGLCGDFNGEVSDELVGPNRELYKNPRRFGRSYQHTTEQCAKENQCAPSMEFAYDTEITLPGNKNQFACITKAPLPRCLPTCRPIQEEPVDVEFVCIEHEGTTDPFATSSRDVIIKKYGRKTSDYKTSLPMATKCSRPN
uniref:Vitellogenin 2 n=1 Tax=Patiriella regularis TaxID=46519 RepID=A0A067Z2V5_PATRE|nr:vitellogenin 2 [Patiriella regularis]